MLTIQLIQDGCWLHKWGVPRQRDKVELAAKPFDSLLHRGLCDVSHRRNLADNMKLVPRVRDWRKLLQHRQLQYNTQY